jgi:hypothetical protein
MTPMTQLEKIEALRRLVQRELETDLFEQAAFHAENIVSKESAAVLLERLDLSNRSDAAEIIDDLGFDPRELDLGEATRSVDLTESELDLIGKALTAYRTELKGETNPGVRDFVETDCREIEALGTRLRLNPDWFTPEE